MDYVRVVADQKEELAVFANRRLCAREQESRIDLDSDQAQIVIGVRRSGKSTLCQKVLRQNGVGYAYVNFDDERLLGLKPEALDSLLEALYVVYGKFTHLFLDEIQNVEGWHLFVNRLLRRGVRLLLTGSNAKLLSSELSTHLTGRFNQIEMFPFSFSEFRLFKGRHVPQSTLDLAALRTDYQEYEMRGGFPEVQTLQDPRAYVRTLYESILLRDILQRYPIKYAKAFADVANAIALGYCQEVNFAALGRSFSIRSVHTIQNYLAYLERAYLLIPLHKFSFKAKIRIRNVKYYAVDPALMSYAGDLAASGPNRGWRMENIVFLELNRRRGREDFELYYYKGRHEVDFVLFRNGKVAQLIQVAYDIANERTLRRELTALACASEDLGCDNLLLITLADEGRHDAGNGRQVDVVPIARWLLDNK